MSTKGGYEGTAPTEKIHPPPPDLRVIPRQDFDALLQDVAERLLEGKPRQVAEVEMTTIVGTSRGSCEIRVSVEPRLRY